MPNDFRLDRSAFKIQSFEESRNQKEYWLTKTPMERLAASWYLTCHAYGLPYHGKHRLDKTVFKMRKHPL